MRTDPVFDLGLVNGAAKRGSMGVGVGAVPLSAAARSRREVRPTGLGQVPPPPNGMSPNQTAPLNQVNPPWGTYVEVFPTDTMGISGNFDIGSILDSLMSVWDEGSGSGYQNINGFIHFFYTCPSVGSIQTVGAVNPDAVFMRFTQTSSGPQIDFATIVTGSKPATATVPAPAPKPSPPASPPSSVALGGGAAAASTSVDQGSYVWNQYAWQYYQAGLNDYPDGGPPPGNAGTQGKWVSQGQGMFDWYPGPGDMGTVVDSSGNTWWIYSSSGGAATGISPPDWASPQGSTTPPPGVTGTGSWQYAHPYYYVWIPTSSASLGEILALLVLGCAIVGGGAYLLLED